MPLPLILLLIAYCCVCWAVMLVLTLCWMGNVREQIASGERGLWVTAFRLTLIAFLGPIVLPCMIVWCLPSIVGCIRHQMRIDRALQSYHEYLFEPMKPWDLPPLTRRYFDMHTPEIFQQHFDLIGDFNIWPEPLVMHDRYFISEDRSVFIGLSVTEDIQSIECISVLSDGTYVGTASMENPPKWPEREADERYQPYCLRGASVAETCLHHQQRLRDFVNLRGCAVLQYEPDQIREVAIYGSRLSGLTMHRDGLRKELPPTPVTPQPRPSTQSWELNSTRCLI